MAARARQSPLDRGRVGVTRQDLQGLEQVVISPDELVLGRQPGATPDAIAPLYWELHPQRDEIEKVFTPSGGEQPIS